MSRAVLLLALLVLTPAAAASPAHEARGSLALAGAVALRGDLDVRGEGLVELDATRGAALSFGGLAEGWVMDRTRDKVHVGAPGAYEPAVSKPQFRNGSLPAGGAGRVENVTCGPTCLVFAYGTVGARGFLDDALAPTAAARDVATSDARTNRSSQVRRTLPAGSLEVASDQLHGAEAYAEGRLVLVLSDASFDLVQGEARRHVNARWENETTREAQGRPLTVRHHARFAVLVLDDAALGRTPFRASFPGGADARLVGVLSSRDATGALDVAGTRHALDRDDVLLEGGMTLRLLGAAPGLVEGARGMDAEVEGQVTRAIVSGRSVLPALAPEAARAGGGALALLVLALAGRLLVAPLYHRLGPSDLLENANRRRIYEAVRARPGAGVGDIVASVGLSRILVRHHLRMLEAHRLVRATTWRRRRTYTVAGDGAGLAACELKDATRRRVASTLAGSGRATQKDLAAALGLSQRLVSYHLARLEAASLVRREGRNPRVYLATEELARAVSREEGAAAALGATAA